MPSIVSSTSEFVFSWNFKGFECLKILLYHLYFIFLFQVKTPFFYPKTMRWQKIYDHCVPFMDENFLTKGKLMQFPLRVSTAESQPSQPLERQKSGQPHASTPGIPDKRSYRAVCPRRSPLYENAFMLAPDGAVLCTCDSKKADWSVFH